MESAPTTRARRSALVISSNLPIDSTKVHGVYRRLDVFIEALAQVVDEIRCLFLVPAHEEWSQAHIAQISERLRERWVKLSRVDIRPCLERESGDLWSRYGRGIFDFHAQSQTTRYRGERTRIAVDEALESGPDLVLAHRLSVMSVLMRARTKVRKPRLVFDMDDVEHIASIRRLIRDPGRRLERLRLLQIPALMLGERRAIRRAGASLVCSSTDRNHLHRTLAVDSVRVIRNSATIPEQIPLPADKPVVLFVGTFNYGPNLQAADFLIREIWPRVRARIPAAELLIVGYGPERLRSFGSRPEGVTFTGFVDDITDVYRRARVVCCPIQMGSGTRVKIIEAAAFGRAVVSTPVGAEGLEFEPGREIILASGADRISRECVDLLLDAARANEIGLAAREVAISLYRRDAVLASARVLFEEAVLG